MEAKEATKLLGKLGRRRRALTAARAELDADVAAAILAATAAGVSKVEIAKRLGASRTTVYDVLRAKETA